MLAEPSLMRVQGDFFTIAREDLRHLTVAELPNAADFYQVCRTTYGENCHVSGAMTSDGGCLVVMRSSQEDDHSRPLLEALKKAAIQFSTTRPAFIAVQFDDIMPTDLLLPHLRRRVGLLSYYLFHGWGFSVEVPATHVAATYFCPYRGLHASPKGIGTPAFTIINPKPRFHVAPGEYSPFLSGIEDTEFVRLLGVSPPTENLSFIPIGPNPTSMFTKGNEGS
jgi:hypothetical protein